MAVRKLLACLALVALGTATAQLLGSRAPAAAPAGGGKSVYDVCASLPDTTQFAQLIRVARADPTVAQLTDPGFVGVVFAPTNKAFEKDAKLIARTLGLPNGDAVLTTPAAAAKLIKTHMIVGQALQLSQLVNDMKLRSASGEVLEIDTGYIATSKSGNAKFVSTEGDVPAGLALIHRIDRVLVPSK
ncbi:FAS1 domain-containing protein [Haematococcus lacustris]|uniref:FAS1 domain-containing protein n=1 Tax=Haematococcus lacustris TaxID=44745 RepID=A0A699ZF78_HAELA|nr:FAS1 domain-containing protein [Haematococcus lacustris]